MPEFNLTAYAFTHNRVGSHYLHIDRNDSNNVFSVNFRTTPFDSTGLPHILEHTSLCGSEKFPVRDPFFKMLNRSVATFMNAMTGSDYTLYPFSSMNESDFRNLQRIYLDAVFKPNLSRLDFLQEGWRIEHTNLRDRKSPFTIKGVVYNEMKGAFSENSSLFGQQLLNSLLPDHTYGFVSGGNPLEIPKLTHEDLVAFHRKYYHPSNARFYSYGTFDLEKSLAYVNEQYLAHYDRIDVSYSKIPNQQRWTQPRNVHISSRYDTMGAPFDKQNQIAVAFLLADITDINETFTLDMLSALLLNGPNSYFYKSMIEPNFSGGYNSTTGYESQIKDTIFNLGLQNIRMEDFPRFQEIFEKTISEVIEKGFDNDHIESILHEYELSTKHQTPKFGLNLLLRFTPLWNHDGDVINALKVGDIIKNFRENLACDSQFLQKKVERYFKNNQHRLTLTMSPDEKYEKKFSDAEKKLLDEKVAKMTDEEKKAVYEDGLALEESQKAPPNSDALPILSLEDVKNPPEKYTLHTAKSGKTPTFVTEVPTNQIAYLKSIFDASHLSKNEVHLLPLFCYIVASMGTKTYDYRTFDKIIKAKTSGINFKLHFAEDINDASKYDIGVLMSTHALDYNTEKMFELVLELLTNYRMDDPERFKMLVENYLSNLTVGVAASGHLFAMQTCGGLVTESAALKSELSSMEHIYIMKDLIESGAIYENRPQLSKLGHKLFDGQTMRAAINTTDEMMPRVMKSYEEFVQKMPKTQTKTGQLKSGLLEPKCAHYIMNIPVNYCAKSFLAVPYTHPDHSTLRLLAKLLSAKYLLPLVREQNGAYGAGATIGLDGIFSFFSYRDPNSGKTLSAFDDTYNWLVQNQKTLNEQTLFEAKLGVLQQLDAPVAPGNKGIDHFLYGLSQEQFGEYRQRMLDVTVPQLREVIEKYFKNPPKHYGKCVLGPENKELTKREGETWSVHGQQ